jgi:hypothetical protein
MLIPQIVSDDEILVRAIFHSLFYSKSDKKIKKEAFLPPPQRVDVSTLRLSYTTRDFCKNHALSITIRNNTYIGLALIKVAFIRNNKDIVDVISTYYDEFGKLVQREEIYSNDKGLPMHADILYNFTPTIEEPIPQKIRVLANEIAKNATFYEDPYPSEKNWNGSEF